MGENSDTGFDKSKLEYLRKNSRSLPTRINGLSR